ncbi:MAG: tetratricopeptide repeat protein [Planctomycetales bacterium]|nr:tetratricopeptide repeat protein [Planctomycetales bacterium]
MAQSPTLDAAQREILRYDVGWKALNTMLKAGRSLSGHERNCAFLNTKAGRFADISAAANIDFDDDGRILALTDWDHDGDEDFWIANRNGPQVRFLRNDSRNDYHFVSFRLVGTKCNRDAIGARVEVHLGDDAEHPLRMRSLRAGEGYLSQSSKWIHFGLGESTAIDKIVVRWPDNSTETITDVKADQRYTITQGDGKAIEWQRPKRDVKLTPSTIQVPESSDQSRIVLIAPVPIPDMKFEVANGESQAVLGNGRARVVNLWASWCNPCLEELKEWSQHAEELNRQGIDVITINVDEPEPDRDQQKKSMLELASKLGLPFSAGFGTKDLVVQFDVLQRSILRRQRPLPVPSSFMIDARGNLRIIYKGPVEAAQLIRDAGLLNASAEEIVASSVPYAGKWLGQPAGTSPNNIAIRFVEGGFLDETIRYIQQLDKRDHGNPMYKPADALVLLGAIYQDQNRLEESAAAFKRVLEIDPNHRQTQIELAAVLFKLKDFAGSAKYYRQSLERRSNDPELLYKLGVSLYENGETEAAIVEIEKAVAIAPTPLAYHQLGNAAIRLGKIADAIEKFEKAVQLNSKFGPSLNNLAWLLATSIEDAVRDGDRAVKYAEVLCSGPNQRTVENLDTLAASYAAAGRFDDAIKTANEAIRAAKAAGDLRSSRDLQNRLTLYKKQQPFRDSL